MGTKLDLELERLFAAFRGTLKVIFCVANKYYEISAKEIKFEEVRTVICGSGRKNQIVNRSTGCMLC